MVELAKGLDDDFPLTGEIFIQRTVYDQKKIPLERHTVIFPGSGYQIEDGCLWSTTFPETDLTERRDQRHEAQNTTNALHNSKDQCWQRLEVLQIRQSQGCSCWTCCEHCWYVGGSEGWRIRLFEDEVHRMDSMRMWRGVMRKVMMMKRVMRILILRLVVIVIVISGLGTEMRIGI